MAYNHKYPNIKRTNGPYPRNKFGIKYNSIAKQQRRLLVEYPIIADRAHDDQFLKIVFNICRHHKSDQDNKYYYDWSKDELAQLNTLKNNYKLIDWQCAISNKPIQANINDFSAQNFVHPDHYDEIKNSISQRVLESSIAFRKHVKKLLFKQQRYFLKLARKNANSDLK